MKGWKSLPAAQRHGRPRGQGDARKALLGGDELAAGLAALVVFLAIRGLLIAT